MSFLEVFQTFNQNLFIYGGAFILVLSLLVFIHEWGHYIVARWCGVKVETFSIGFGKELFGWDDKNGTRWKFSLVPLGGYVKLFGDVDPASAQHSDSIEDEDTGEVRLLTESEKEVAFFNKPVWQRASVVFAGPAINYIFAVLVMAVLFSWNGQPVTTPKAAAVIGGSSADEYGFKPHDLIVSIDGKPVDSFEFIRREVMIALDEERHFVVQRGDQLVDIHARARKIEEQDRFGFKHSRGLLGLISPRHVLDVKSIKEINGRATAEEDVEKTIAQLSRQLDTNFSIGLQRGDDIETLYINPKADFNEFIADPEHEKYGLLFLSDGKPQTFARYGPVQAVFEAIREARDVTVGTLEALGQIIVGTRSAKELGGIVRIGALAGDMAQQGIIALTLFTALLSINLGLINLFPIPLLDGGHLVFYAFEAILGRPIPEQMQEYAFRFGLVFLVGVMVFTNLNDIMQLIL